MKNSQWLLLVLCVATLSLWLAAQTHDRDSRRGAGENTSVTGCLSKGDSPNEFYLTSKDGKKYEIRSDTVSISDHVGQQVTVNGTSVAEGKGEDRDEDEKNERAENKTGDMQVTKLQMVSTTCQ